MLIDHHFEQPSKEWYVLYKNIVCKKCLEFPQRPEGIDCNFNEDERKKCTEMENLNEEERRIGGEKKTLAEKRRYLNVRQISAYNERINNVSNILK